MKSWPTETGFVSINDAQLYFEVAGVGEPLVLVHAGVADSRMWSEQIEAFAPAYRVLCYDLRGFGQSQVPVHTFAQHEELVELLAHLGLARVSIIGISYGSKIALDFTLAHPELVEKLVLVAPVVSGSPSAPDVLEFYDAEEEALNREDLAGATELNVRMWVDGPRRTGGEVDPEVRDRVREMQYLAFQTVFPEGAIDIDLEPPAILRLTEVKAPTLIVVGDYDVQSVQDLAQRLTTEMADAQLAVIAGTAHMVNMEKPTEFNRVVLDFLR